MTAWPKLVLFDLDGTLIDSVPDIAVAVNKLMVSENHAPFSEIEVRSMVGHGLGKLVERAFSHRGVTLSPGELQNKLGVMGEIYMRDLASRTTLLPGVTEALAPRVGRRVALVTNKLQAATDGLVDHFGLREAFAMVVGDSGIPLKPAPDMLLHIAAVLGVSTKDTVMVGDSAADIESARRAGIASILVEGGYSDVPPGDLGADMVIKDLFQLEAALRALAPR